MNYKVCYSLVLTILDCRGSNALPGNQSREKLRTWLAPPNPSINHNTACDIHHDGTAKWFVQGSTFDDWKKDGSLLWIRGNRTLLLSNFLQQFNHLFGVSGVWKECSFVRSFMSFPVTGILYC